MLKSLIISQSISASYYFPLYLNLNQIKNIESECTARYYFLKLHNIGDESATCNLTGKATDPLKKGGGHLATEGKLERYLRAIFFCFSAFVERR